MFPNTKEMKAIELIKEFKKYNIGPYIEVPCSILGPLISQLMKDKSCEVINPVSEAVASGIAAGSYLASKKIPMILMQNSGLANVLNSLTSLNQIYMIPAVYFISWRGQPGIKDAPQHRVMGEKLKGLLETLDIPYSVLSDENFKEEIAGTISMAEKSRKPAALILKKGFFEKESAIAIKSLSALTKEAATDTIIKLSHDKAYFITTNGFISREVFYNLAKTGKENSVIPFYMLGSMGHALGIALGVERYLENDKKVIALDGDGGCLMHLGALASVGDAKHKRLIHVVLDNGTYASTGGQATVSRQIDFCKIAQGCGYKNINKFCNKNDLNSGFLELLKKPGPSFAHVLIAAYEDTKRPRISELYSCEEVKHRFMKTIANESRG